MKLRGVKESSNHVADKNMNIHRIKKLPFPIILCIAIILATSLIYFAVATTDGGADNSRGLSFRKSTTQQSNKSKDAAKNSKSKDDKQEVASDSTVATPSEQNKSDNKNDLAKKKALDEKKKAAADKAKSSKSSDSKGKTWVPPVYRYVNHPAETRTVTIYSCKGGTFSSMEALRDAQQKYIRRNHLPGCDGTFSNIQETTRTEVVKAAWTEKILVSEGYWK